MSASSNKLRRRERLLLWAPVLVWALAIFFVSAQSTLPAIGEDWLDRAVKQLSHSLEYAVFAWLVWRPLTHFGESRGRRHYLVAWLLCFAYALSDEFHQSFVPGRVADWRDLLADGLGAAAVLLALARWQVARSLALLGRRRPS